MTKTTDEVKLNILRHQLADIEVRLAGYRSWVKHYEGLKKGAEDTIRRIESREPGGSDPWTEYLSG